MKRLRAYVLGLREGWAEPDLGVGMTYDRDPASARSVAYDRGVNLGQRLRWGRKG
jgi:hypothetical protein